MDQISIHEAQEMRKILESIFGSRAQSWIIKYATYEALAKLILQSPRRTKFQHLVPKPHDFISPFKWGKQAREAMLYYFGTDEGKQTLISMRSAGLQMRKAFEEARYAGY